MRRVNIFLISLLSSISALLILTVIGFGVSSSPQGTQQYPGWMGQMSGMMGQTGTTIATGNSALYFWSLFAVVAAFTIISTIGIVYYLVYPQIRMGIAYSQNQLSNNQPNKGAATPYESIEKTLTEDERKVINVISAHEGKYLQKYITKEAGLSKLKTHRIVTRLAERGIVSLEKTGNTNQVTLANWLKPATIEE
jgi:hypothetical protein